MVEECCTENGPPSCVPVGTCGQASCEAPSDCPGQVCCQWGGVVTACGTSCPGGEQVCEHNNDCPSNASHCCATQFGADVCRSSCF